MRAVRSQTLYWMAITFVLFPILILLGIYMRSVQAGALGALEAWFYPMMTLHGVGMVGVWYVASVACAANVLAKYVAPSPAVSTSVEANSRVCVEAATVVTQGLTWLVVAESGPSLPAEAATKTPAL